MSSKRAVLGVAVATLLSLAACGKSDSNQGNDAAGGGGRVIHIGAVISKTGFAAGAYGLPFLNGLELGLADVKKSGYLDKSGIKLDVKSQDDGSELNGAITAYNTLMRDKPEIILSSGLTPLAAGLSPLANEDKVLFLSGAGSKVENAQGYTFVLNDIRTPMATLGAYLAAHKAQRVAAIIDGDSAAAPTMAGSTEAGLVKAGGTKYVLRQTVGGTETDFSSVLTKVRGAKPDAVQLSTLAEQSGNILRQMQQAGGFEKTLKVGTVGWTPQVYDVAKDAAVGAVFPVPWAPGEAASADFEKSYSDATKTAPNAYSAIGYQVAWLLAVAANESASGGGDVTSTKLRDGLVAAAASPDVKEHGVIDGFSLTKEGLPGYPGTLATFESDGSVVALKD